MYKWIIGGAFLLILTLLGLQTVRLHDARADLAEERAGTAKMLQAYAERASRAVQKLSAQKAAHAAAQQEIVHDFNKERRARLSAESLLSVTDQRLRDTIRAYASDSGPGTDASACRSAGDRSATLGLLLEDALGVSRALAQGAEQHAGEVRFLKRIIENDRAGCAPLAGD